MFIAQYIYVLNVKSLIGCNCASFLFLLKLYSDQRAHLGCYTQNALSAACSSILQVSGFVLGNLHAI